MLYTSPSKAAHACMERVYYVYIMASRYRGTLYTGITSDILRRVAEHKRGQIEGFTATYGIKTLVWWEAHECPHQAIRREKRLKRWRRAWKFDLIEKRNPEWQDLTPRLMSDVG